MKRGWYYTAGDKFIGPFASEEQARWASSPVALTQDRMPKEMKGSVALMTRGFAGLAFDKETVRAKDKDGRLHIAMTNISKANICDYFGHEIPGWQELRLDPRKKYRLLRDPKELEKAAHTFNNLPLLSKHVGVSADDHRSDLTIGSTGTDAHFEHPYLKNSLVVWPSEAISAIESEQQKELSCAYRYTPDMTPGSFEGQSYDGVMRDIVGNHVALVKEGRAGSDVVVGDSKESLNMPNIVLSRKGVATLGALIAYLRPRLAADAKPNLYPIIAGLTAKNFAEKKHKLAHDIKTQLKPLLAKDATMDDITNLLDALEKEEVAEGADTEPNSGLPMSLEEMEKMREKKAEDEEMMWDKRAKDACTALGRDETPEEREMREKKQCSEDARHRLGRDETPEECAAREHKEAEDRKARDAKRAKDAGPEMKPETYDKKAMDAKIAEAVATATKQGAANAMKVANDIRDAERAVEPYVGKLALTFDTAEGVYRKALSMIAKDGKPLLSDAELAELNLAGMKAVLKSQPVPGQRQQAKPQFAQDSASADYGKRWANADKIVTV